MREEEIRYVFQILGVRRWKKTGNNLVISCPFSPYTEEGHPSGKDRTPSYCVEISDGPSRVHCFGCHHHSGSLAQSLTTLQFASGRNLGDAIDWVRAREKVDEKQALAKVAEYFGVQMTDLDQISEDTRAIVAERAQHDTWSDDELRSFQFSDSVHPYLESRGFTSVDGLEIGYDPARRRVVMPVRRRDGGLVGVVGRAIDASNEPRYLNYWNFNKGLYLYGEDRVKKGCGPVIVVEGMLDRAWLVSLGYRNTVGMMGSELSAAQAGKIRRWGLDAYIMLDGDAAGRYGTKQAIKRLEGRIHLLCVSMPDGLDPQNLNTREEVQALLDAAVLPPQFGKSAA